MQVRAKRQPSRKRSQIQVEKRQNIIKGREKTKKSARKRIFTVQQQVGLSPPKYSTGPQLSSPQSTVVRPQFVKCDEVALVKCHVELKTSQHVDRKSAVIFLSIRVNGVSGPGLTREIRLTRC